MRSLKCAVIVGANVLVATSTWGATFFVDPAGSGTNGLSWPNAFPTVNAAIAAAGANDEIRISQGVFKPTATTTRTISFDINKTIIIRGGYAGLANPGNPDARDIDTYVTILSGDIGTASVTSDNSLHVVKFSSTSSTVTNTLLEGVTVKLGSADTGTPERGGGIWIDANVSPTIRNCKIIDNHADEAGGGIYCADSSNAAIRNTLIQNNSSTYGGGVFTGTDSDVKILNCVVHDNAATSLGGGIRADDADSLAVVSCTISGNSSVHDGGGISIQGPSGLNVDMRVVNCLIIDNEVTNNPGYGGGIAFTKGIGGVINCTFDGNSATKGGAYYQFNTANPNESALENCILWDNGDEEARTDNGTLTIRYCDIDGGIGAVVAGAGASVNDAGNNINANPQYLNPGAGDYRLYAGSPCRHTGVDGAVPADVNDVNENANLAEDTPDRLLDTRIVCHVDMGAFEWRHGCLLGDVNNDGFINTDDLIIIITTWGICVAPQPLMGCYGDIYPPCGDGYINTDDLIQVVGGWGECPGEESLMGGGMGGGGDEEEGHASQAIQACVNAANESGLEGQAYLALLRECLCEHGLIKCDE